MITVENQKELNLSIHTITVLQTLAQYFGTLLLQTQSGDNGPSSEVNLLLDELAPPQQGNKYPASTYLLDKILNAQGGVWGSILLRVSIPV